MLNEVVAQDILIKAMELWGFDSQANILQEECAELIHAFCKLRREKHPFTIGCFEGSTDKICEEIADVKIVIAQFETDTYYKEGIEKWVAFKMGRLATTMKEYEREKKCQENH